MDFTKTIIPLSLMASESIAHSALWAIDLEPIRARGIIVKYIYFGGGGGGVRAEDYTLTWSESNFLIQAPTGDEV